MILGSNSRYPSPLLFYSDNSFSFSSSVAFFSLQHDVHESEEISLKELHYLLGHIIYEKVITKEAFKSMISTIWNLKGKVNIKEAGLNIIF